MKDFFVSFVFSSCRVLFSFRLFLLAFRSQAVSGEEITDNFVYPRFKLGAQSGKRLHIAMDIVYEI